MGIRGKADAHCKKGKNMNEEQRIKLLEEEVKILKNEVKTILLDIREQYLNIQNPFNALVANTGTPPAGVSPDIKDNPEEVSQEEVDIGENDQLSPAPVEDTPDMSFGKPFPDLTGKLDKPGLQAGMGEAAGPGPSSGPVSSAGVQTELRTEDEEDAEPPQKAKSSRSRKKREMEVEEEMELHEEADEEDEDQEDRRASKSLTGRGGKKKNLASSTVGTRADLVVIAGLTQWVDQATAKLGKDRTEALVEMSTAMGRIPEKLRDVMIRMIRISRYEANGQTPTATDYLATLAQLESLMGGSPGQDNALLSVLSMMKESARG